ncbi:hypothetical protein TNIN_177991, partial [Trichonephila inaurata madagascariensis]
DQKTGTESVTHDLPVSDLLSKKALKLANLAEIESIHLSAAIQLEPVNSSTSSSDSTVRISVGRFASEKKAVVSGTIAFGVVCKRNLLDIIKAKLVKIHCTLYEDIQ